MNILKDEICDLAYIDRDIEVAKIVLEQQFYRLSQKKMSIYRHRYIKSPYHTVFIC